MIMPGIVKLSEFLPLLPQFHPVHNRLTCRHRPKCAFPPPAPAPPSGPAPVSTPRSPQTQLAADPREKAWRKLLCSLLDTLRDFPPALDAAKSTIARLCAPGFP